MRSDDNQEPSLEKEIVLARKWIEIIPIQIKVEELKKANLKKQLKKKFIPKSTIKALAFLVVFIPLLSYLTKIDALLWNTKFIFDVSFSHLLCLFLGNLFGITFLVSAVNDIEGFMDYRNLKKQDKELEEKIALLSKNLKEKKTYLSGLLEKERLLKEENNKDESLEKRKNEEKESLVELKKQMQAFIDLENENKNNIEASKTKKKKL